MSEEIEMEEGDLTDSPTSVDELLSNKERCIRSMCCMGKTNSEPKRTKENDASKLDWKKILKQWGRPCGLIAVNLILTIVVIARIANLKKTMGQVPPSVESVLCVPESSFHPPECSELSRTQTGNASQCCGPARMVLERLVLQATANKYRDEIALSPGVRNLGRSSCQLKPAAKVQGIQSKGSPNLRWKEWPIKGNGIDFNGTHLNFSRPGYYYIYTQIEFNLGRKHPGNERPAFRLYRHRHRDGVTEELLEGLKCRQRLLPSSNATSSSAGSVFEFRGMDAASVWVPHPAAVTDSLHGNFFGAFLI